MKIKQVKKQYKIPKRINNNRYPKMMNIIDTIKKLIGYVISYGPIITSTNTP